MNFMNELKKLGLENAASIDKMIQVVHRDVVNGEIILKDAVWAIKKNLKEFGNKDIALALYLKSIFGVGNRSDLRVVKSVNPIHVTGLLNNMQFDFYGENDGTWEFKGCLDPFMSISLIGPDHEAWFRISNSEQGLMSIDIAKKYINLCFENMIVAAEERDLLT